MEIDKGHPLHSAMKEFEKEHDITGLSVEYAYPDGMDRKKFYAFYEKIYNSLFSHHKPIEGKEYIDGYIDAVIVLKKTIDTLIELNPELAKVDRSYNPFLNLNDNDIRELIKVELENEPSQELKLNTYKKYMKDVYIVEGTLYHYPPSDIDWLNGFELLDSSQRKEYKSRVNETAARFERARFEWTPSPETLSKLNEIADQREGVGLFEQARHRIDWYFYKNAVNSAVKLSQLTYNP